MHGGEILIPLTIFGGGFAMIFGIVYLKTRENLAMLEKGMNPRQPMKRLTAFISLKLGLLLMGAGMGLLIAFFIDAYSGMRTNENPAIYFSLIAIGGGAGLVFSYFIEKKTMQKEEDANNKQ